MFRFKWMLKDKELDDVTVDITNNKVTVIQLGSKEMPLLSINSIFNHIIFQDAKKGWDLFVESRLFSKNRPDVDILCMNRGFKYFDSLGLFRQSRGKMASDDFWVKFEDETLNFIDIMYLPGKVS